MRLTTTETMPIRKICIGWICIALADGALAQPAPPPTYANNVATILQNRCQNCHRPGEAAPFPLLTYEQARPWAKAIKGAVVQGKMPPWFADRHYGKFANDSSLPQNEIDALVNWVDAGAPLGNPKELPAAKAVCRWLGDS